MPEPQALLLFLAAALVIALTPGPGLIYVAARTLSGGVRAGIASSLGTGLGGFVHVAAGAVGLSALLAASAEAFTLLKLAGAAYLVWLGLRTLATDAQPLDLDVAGTGSAHAFRDGVLVEALNPKTAIFFLAFLPQFVDPAAGRAASQFLLLGTLSVILNTSADLVVVALAGRIRSGFAAHPGPVRRLRQASGAVLCGLGITLALARRPS